MPIILKKGGRTEQSNAVILGAGLTLAQTPDGLPELGALGGAGEAVLEPSGGDDTQAIQQKLWESARVRLAPGTFRVTAPIDLPAGAAVSGTGVDRTVLSKADYAGPVFRLGDQTQAATIERLTIAGPGVSSGAGNEGIVCWRSPAGLAAARQLRFSDLRLTGLSAVAIYAGRCEQVTLSGVVVEGVGSHGVLLDGGGGHHLSAVRVEGAVSGAAIVVRGTHGTVLSACVAAGSHGSFFVDGSRGVVLDGCASWACGDVPLYLSDARTVTVSAFVSDNGGLGRAMAKPHLLVVGAGTAGVTVNGFRRVNPPEGITDYEAIVGAECGPATVGQHEFTRAAIAPSGRFTEIQVNPVT
jgi:Right handed beta helix region